jgi:hypothetical protein
MKKITICDPPSGWQYDFPRPIPQEVLDEMELQRAHSSASAEKVFKTWLVSCGYPQSLIESFGEHFYCRYWEQEDEQP